MTRFIKHCSFSEEEQKGGTPIIWSVQNGEAVKAGGCQAQEDVFKNCSPRHRAHAQTEGPRKAGGGKGPTGILRPSANNATLAGMKPAL